MKPGDLVQLRSGGPAMVISEMQRDPFAGEGWLCFWSVQGALRRDTFPEVVLIPYEPEATPGSRAKAGPGADAPAETWPNPA